MSYSFALLCFALYCLIVFTFIHFYGPMHNACRSIDNNKEDLKLIFTVHWLLSLIFTYLATAADNRRRFNRSQPFVFSCNKLHSIGSKHVLNNSSTNHKFDEFLHRNNVIWCSINFLAENFNWMKNYFNRNWQKSDILTNLMEWTTSTRYKLTTWLKPATFGSC